MQRHPLPQPHDTPLNHALRRLAALLGPDDFYRWASALPDSVILDDDAYLDVLNDRLHELQPLTIPATHIHHNHGMGPGND